MIYDLTLYLNFHLISSLLFKLPPLAFQDAVIYDLTMYLNFHLISSLLFQLPPLAFNNAMI